MVNVSELEAHVLKVTTSELSCRKLLINSKFELFEFENLQVYHINHRTNYFTLIFKTFLTVLLEVN